MPGLVPGTVFQQKQVVDGRDIGEHSDAVLWTDMPGHDDCGRRKASSLACRECQPCGQGRAQPRLPKILPLTWPAKAKPARRAMGRFGMDALERSIGDLVIANRILAKEEVVDAYGHVSIRHPSKPDHYLLSRSLSPEFVTRADIIEFKLDGTPVSDTRPAYLERYIHGAVYEARPDINAVIHSHAEAVLPFSVSEDADVLRCPRGERYGYACPGLGYRRKIRRRDQSPGHQHGSGPRHGQEARQEFSGADARPRISRPPPTACSSSCGCRCTCRATPAF